MDLVLDPSDDEPDAPAVPVYLCVHNAPDVRKCVPCLAHARLYECKGCQKVGPQQDILDHRRRDHPSRECIMHTDDATKFRNRRDVLNEYKGLHADRVDRQCPIPACDFGRPVHGFAQHFSSYHRQNWTDPPQFQMFQMRELLRDEENLKRSHKIFWNQWKTAVNLKVPIDDLIWKSGLWPTELLRQRIEPASRKWIDKHAPAYDPLPVEIWALISSYLTMPQRQVLSTVSHKLRVATGLTTTSEKIVMFNLNMISRSDMFTFTKAKKQLALPEKVLNSIPHRRGFVYDVNPNPKQQTRYYEKKDLAKAIKETYGGWTQEYMKRRQTYQARSQAQKASAFKTDRKHRQEMLNAALERRGMPKDPHDAQYKTYLAKGCGEFGETVELLVEGNYEKQWLTSKTSYNQLKAEVRADDEIAERREHLLARATEARGKLGKLPKRDIECSAERKELEEELARVKEGQKQLEDHVEHESIRRATVDYFMSGGANDSSIPYRFRHFYPGDENVEAMGGDKGKAPAIMDADGQDGGNSSDADGDEEDCQKEEDEDEDDE